MTQDNLHQLEKNLLEETMQTSSTGQLPKAVLLEKLWQKLGWELFDKADFAAKMAKTLELGTPITGPIQTLMTQVLHPTAFGTSIDQ